MAMARTASHRSVAPARPAVATVRVRTAVAGNRNGAGAYDDRVNTAIEIKPFWYSFEYLVATRA